MARAEAPAYEFHPPDGVVLLTRDQVSVQYRDTITPRYLEFWSNGKSAPKGGGKEVDLDAAVPTIGRITATTPLEPRGANGKLFWFRQRSSVNHTPMIAAGFLVLGRSGFLVVRVVAPDSSEGDGVEQQRVWLERLLKDGALRLK